MKFTGIKLAAVTFAAAGLFAFNSLRSGSIKGTVSPAEAALKVWAISNTDTFQAKVDKGIFEIKDLVPGNYNLVVEATAPYKSIGKQDVPVADGKPTDVGQIQLTK